MGGTVTTLVALVHELEPYDSSFVHLRELSLEQVSAAIERMSVLDAEDIAALPGVQPKRAGVILAGAVVIRELMRAGGYKTLTVSENSLLAGMAATINEEAVTLEDVYEPYLMQLGFLTRTPRGRCATRLAYEHLGLKAPESGSAEDNGQQSLF